MINKNFWSGFEKRAVSLTGMMGGLRSGSKAFSAPGQIAKAVGPKTGIAVAPRAVPPSLPTATKIPTNNNLLAKPQGKSIAMPKIPKPAKQSGKGVSSTTI